MIEDCSDCGWAHANVPDCWRRTRREALERLADPHLSGELRVKLQAALDAFECYRLETIEFFRAAGADE